MTKRKQDDADLDTIPFPANRPLGSKRAKSGKSRKAPKSKVRDLKLSLQVKKKELLKEIKKTKNDVKVVERDLVKLRKITARK